MDQKIGYWIKGVPYVWIGSGKEEECKRFYILHHNTAALFDSKNRLVDPTFIKSEMYAGRLDLKETFSLLPLADKKCKTIRNFFLIWTFGPSLGSIDDLLFKTTIKGKEVKFQWGGYNPDIRVEGYTKFLIRTPPLLSSGYITVVNDSYKKRLELYPQSFAAGDDLPKGGITLTSAQGERETFRNLDDAAEKMGLDKDVKVTKIHIAALQGSLDAALARRAELRKEKVPLNLPMYKSLEESIADITEEIEGLPDVRGARALSIAWSYGLMPDIPTVRAIYRMITGEQKRYEVRK
jgi:hypothetical protein